MKTQRFVLAFLILMLLPAAAQADCYVITGGGPPAGTQIKSLPYTISAPGLYFIKQNLTCPAGSHGITVTSDDVTLDLMGFTLSGPGSGGSKSGVYILLQRNVEIRNGSIQGFYNGIYAENLNNIGHRVINVRAHDNGFIGIYMIGKSHLVQGCTSFANGRSGIFADENSIAWHCTAYNNAYNGISVDQGSSVIECASYGNSENGISGGTGHVSIVSNNCYSNTKSGINTFSYSLVKGNVCNSNGVYGIATSNGCLIVQNVCNSNTSGNIHTGTGCSSVDNVAP